MSAGAAGSASWLSSRILGQQVGLARTRTNDTRSSGVKSAPLILIKSRTFAGLHTLLRS